MLNPTKNPHILNSQLWPILSRNSDTGWPIAYTLIHALILYNTDISTLDHTDLCILLISTLVGAAFSAYCIQAAYKCEKELYNVRTSLPTDFPGGRNARLASELYTTNGVRLHDLSPSKPTPD